MFLVYRFSEQEDNQMCYTSEYMDHVEMRSWSDVDCVSGSCPWRPLNGCSPLSECILIPVVLRTRLLI